jgi:small subunit ribosomal protein S20
VANIKSQIKRIKTNEKARLRNKSVRSSIKTAARKFRDAVSAGDAAVISTELRTASKALDIAVAKGVLHKNTAANKKSSMAKAAVKAGVR